MACQRCGCRIPARLHPRSSLLVCADCGTALPSVSFAERRNGWLGVAAVGGAALLTAGVMIASALSLDTPTLADRQAEARVSDGPAGE
ncbi:MAG: hypothetical protein ACKO7Z_06705 [Cyanobacteriota bacterium]